MQVIITDDVLAGIPSLVFRSQQSLLRSAPLILLFHRFTVLNALDANLGYVLAKAGFDVVCPEASGHGSRFDGDEKKRLSQFWQILHRTLEEVPSLVEACGDRGIGDLRRIGVFGTSMGGFAVTGAMIRYPWIQAGAAFMGGGYFADAMSYVHPPCEGEKQSCLVNLRDYDAQHHAAQLAGRALFLWHGAQDNVVSSRESERLRDSLNALNGAGKLTCIIDPQGEHKITSASMEAGVRFMCQYLQ
ncbi:hypothetical protein DT73_18230 [Mangrovibacter sp. MFB070]|uniref:esterase n=1 Tax=Mangrovibacter sp. MFB070 TaxID=1224318 RepID=UPI0004DAEECE|nr:esterase [Mangrovibacter sp. MFB070]KEA51301.1 hypothetical protein DT73_18230 [Mangrovibacter sp. MFB070]